MLNAKYATERRLELKLSQEALGRLTGISSQLISKYERGRVTPGKRNLRKLAKGLQTTEEALWSDETPATQIAS